MKLNEMKPTPGARKDKYRVARGMAQGRGKQAGRGQSGQNKRGSTRPGFEGGQNPLIRRLPKIGFVNHNAVTFQVVSLGRLNEVFKDGAVVDPKTLREAGLINRNLPVKVLAGGKLDKKLTVKVAAFSVSARTEIINKGGSAETI